MRPQMAANYGPPRGPGIPGMAQAMGMGRFREGNAGELRRPGAEMARQAVGSAPSDATAAAFLRALGGDPNRMGAMPGMSSGYQDDMRKFAFAAQGGHPNMNPIVARRQVGSHEFAQAPMRPAGDGRQSYSENMAMVPRVWKSSPEHDPAILAYVTPKEMDMLREADIYGSNISERMHFGPEFVPSLQGDGVGGGEGGGGTGGADAPDNSASNMGGWSDNSGPNAPGPTGPGFGGGGFGNYDDASSRTGPAPGPEAFNGPAGGDYDDASSRTGPAPGPEGFGLGQSPVGGGLRSVAKDVAQGKVGPNTAMNAATGVLGTAVPGIGALMGLTQAARALGLSETDGPDPESGPGASDTGVGGSSFIKPTAVAPQGLTRPAAMDAPSFLDFESEDPLQRRAKIATFATQGTGGKWATDEAFNYWKNLTQRDLISDAGQMPDFANLLGTELGYLGSRGIAAPNQTRALLEAILSA